MTSSGLQHPPRRGRTEFEPIPQKCVFRLLLCVPHAELERLVSRALPPMLSISPELLGVEVANCNLEDADIPNKSFDIVLTNYAIEHLDDPMSRFARVQQSAQAEGHLVIDTPRYQTFILTRLDWFSTVVRPVLPKVRSRWPENSDLAGILVPRRACEPASDCVTTRCGRILSKTDVTGVSEALVVPARLISSRTKALGATVKLPASRPFSLTLFVTADGA